MPTYVLDAEWLVREGGDPVLDAEKVHCICLKELNKNNWVEFSDGDTNSSISGFKYWCDSQESGNTYIAHNLLSADLEVFRRLLGVQYTVGRDTLASTECSFVDTLTMSRRLFPDRPYAYWKGKGAGNHGLKAWGIRNKLYKPEVENWIDLPIEVYLHRCREDVINNEATYLALLEEKMSYG